MPTDWYRLKANDKERLAINHVQSDLSLSTLADLRFETPDLRLETLSGCHKSLTYTRFFRSIVNLISIINV